jgi:hypothetical protein
VYRNGKKPNLNFVTKLIVWRKQHMAGYTFSCFPERSGKAEEYRFAS